MYDVNLSNLRWTDSPAGLLWDYYGYNAFDINIRMPKSCYTMMARKDQEDADRSSRSKRRRGQSPNEDDPD